MLCHRYALIHIENGAGLGAIMYEEKDHLRGGSATLSQNSARDPHALQDTPVEAFRLPSAKVLETARPLDLGRVSLL